jgi:hypothetical protein
MAIAPYLNTLGIDNAATIADAVKHETSTAW